jgi:hypothetical protein
MSKVVATIIAAAATFAVATPSFAAAPPLEVKAKAVEKNGQTLYCLKLEAVTGSMIPSKTCLTREAWAEKNVRIVEISTADKANALASNH